MNFLSDNAAPVAPAVLEAIVQANDGFAVAYGDDEWTRSVERHLSQLFEREVAAFLVPTGTAANALALPHLTPPWGAVLCHADSHKATDECGAPEFFGGGLKLVELPGEGAKITAETLNGFLADNFGHSPHHVIPSALSITQASEAGTVYRLDEIAALCEIAHERSLAVHMDGARFANALVRLDATPAQLTWQSGVDVLSFGATKAGALAVTERMIALGYDPNADTAPAKIGRRAAAAVLAACREDGANEAGNFADTTGYAPRKTDAPDAWQPIEFFGKRQPPTTPHWGWLLPFALSRADQFRPVPPPAPGTSEWSDQIDVLIKTSGALTDAQKAAAEFWAEWGSSPASHLMELTKFVANANDLRLNQDVKLFFVVSNAMLDASVATWEAKYTYDYVRPITAIRALGDAPIKAWRPRSLPTVLEYSTPPTRLSVLNDSVTISAGIWRSTCGGLEALFADASVPSLRLRPQRLRGSLGAGYGAGHWPLRPELPKDHKTPLCRAAGVGAAGRSTIQPSPRPPRRAECPAFGEGSTGQPTTSVARSSAERLAKMPGSAPSNSCSAPRPQRRQYSRRCIRHFGSTTAKPPSVRSVFKPKAGSQ